MIGGIATTEVFWWKLMLKVLAPAGFLLLLIGLDAIASSPGEAS
jgi:hypothetical protein